MALVFCSDKTYVGIVWRLNDDERQGTPGWAYCTVHIYQSGKCRRLPPKIVKVRTCGKLELQHFVVFFEFVLAIAPTPSSGCPYRHRDLRLLITNAYQLRFFAFSLPLSPARAAVGTTFVQIGLALISTWVTSSKFDNGRVDVQMYTRTHIIYIHRYPPQNARCNCTHFFVATSLHEINLASPSLIYTASSRSNVWNQRDQHFFLKRIARCRGSLCLGSQAWSLWLQFGNFTNSWQLHPRIWRCRAFTRSWQDCYDRRVISSTRKRRDLEGGKVQRGENSELFRYIYTHNTYLFTYLYIDNLIFLYISRY